MAGERRGEQKEKRAREGQPSGDRGGASRSGTERKVPYYDGYFGTGEEEGVEREREVGAEDAVRPARPDAERHSP